MEKKKLLIIIGSVVALILTIVLILMFTRKEEPVTYTVTFDTDGGSFISTQTVNEGEKVNKPINPTKKGYIFDEWIYQNKTYDFNLEVTQNLILRAKWVEVKEEVEQYIIKFDTDGGTEIPNQTIGKGNKVQRPVDPTKEGYTFKEWTLNEMTFDFETIVESNLELKAKWEEVVETSNNITNTNTNQNNNNSNNTNNNNNSNNTSNNNASNNNSNTNNNNSNNSNNSNNNNNNNKPVAKKYTVVFNSNGGSSVASQTITEGNKATRPGNPTRSGYNFVRWTLNGSEYNFNTPVTGNITLVAQWNEIVKNNYTVNFNSNGGSSVQSQTVTEGNRATRPGNPTRTGYNFAGWTLNGSNYNFDTPVNGNITLVAKWTQKNYRVVANRVDNISPARVLTVYEDGKVITVQTIQYSDGSTLCSGSNPNVNYYAIEGETSLKLVLAGGTTVTASLTIN